MNFRNISNIKIKGVGIERILDSIQVIWRRSINYFFIENVVNKENIINIIGSQKLKLEYSINKLDWKEYLPDSPPILTKVGDRLYFRGDNPRFGNTFNPTSLFSTGGDITTLLHPLGNIRDIRNSDGCFENLFRSSMVVDASKLLLTPDMLSVACYRGMFYSCVDLKLFPELPARYLADRCYEQMFQNCPLMDVTPELPAERLYPYCYKYMFRNCKNLYESSKVNALELADYCCQGMFMGCDMLMLAPDLVAEVAKPHCYDSMFKQCLSLPATPYLGLTILADSCCINMYLQCESLEKVYDLKPEEPANKCFMFMFKDCISLRTAPVLNIRVPNLYCYNGIFRGCKQLNHIEIVADTWNTRASTQWVVGVSSYGDFVKPKNINMGTDVNSIPAGWNVIEY